jgi:RNA polymerase sigma-70 factor (ECF subfamily)
MSELDVEYLYRTYGPMVLRRARAILGEEQAARDAMQEVFVRVLRGADGFRGDASPTTWLYRMTTNLCLNQIRDRARRADILAERWIADEQLDVAHEGRLTVGQVLSGLPDDLREIAIYYFVDQMNQDEIAEVLGVSRRTVGNRLEEFRVRARAATTDRWEQSA